MFWKFDLHTSSHVDTLLEREDVTLFELLDEEDVLQECKVVNRKLVEFLIRPHNMEALVTCITQEPPADIDERVRFKYPSVSCEILTADVSQINDALGDDESLLMRLYSFLQSNECLNPLLASFFSKVMGILINRKTEQIVGFLRKKDDFVSLLLQHIGTSAIMDLLLRLLTCVEHAQLRQDVFNWLNEEKIVQRLIEMIHPSKDDNQHSNASQSLCDITRLSREHSFQMVENPEPDQLLSTLEKQDVIGQLLSNMFDGVPNESVVVNGIQVLLTLLEPRRPRNELGGMSGFYCNMDGQLEMNPPELDFISSQASVGTLVTIKDNLRKFHQLLLEPPKKASLQTTWGILDPPLGNTRLNVVKLVASSLNANNEALNQELMDLGTMNVILDLYFQYMFNNFLHSQVEVCVSTILNMAPAEEPNENISEVEQENHLVKHLLQKCNLVQRILLAWDENEKEQTTGGRRKGYMGHLTRMANALVQSAEKGPNVSLLGHMLKDLPENEQVQWETFTSGSLSETNKKNTIDLVNTHNLHCSSDDEESDLKEFSFPHEASLQQAFMDYQMQQMTSTFIDHFGFNDEEFGEQEESVNAHFRQLKSAPFDKTANITFSLHADDDSPNANLFDICCKERIQQFDDEDDEGSDGEDIWQEKDMRYSSGTIQSSGPRSCGSTDSEDSHDSDDEQGEDEDTGGGTGTNSTQQSSTSSFAENQEAHSWTANFDSLPTETSTTLSMTAAGLGSSSWDGTASGGPCSPAGEGWAMHVDPAPQISSPQMRQCHSTVISGTLVAPQEVLENIQLTCETPSDDTSHQQEGVFAPSSVARDIGVSPVPSPVETSYALNTVACNGENEETVNPAIPSTLGAPPCERFEATTSTSDSTPVGELVLHGTALSKAEETSEDGESLKDNPAPGSLQKPHQDSDANPMPSNLQHPVHSPSVSNGSPTVSLAQSVE
ncbi:serine/threonine-protein phosphatase 6 regulatory subunit 1 isoform X2 [Ambystoma mexicanum]|uniref:serine/threonine-protein phosphatase 6 regulatory subunit 1 isoform X2 n=1 Tax=Ambystoma mexicanum TaxID=8296 RepID=UPI0037E8167D